MLRGRPAEKQVDKDREGRKHDEDEAAAQEAPAAAASTWCSRCDGIELLLLLGVLCFCELSLAMRHLSLTVVVCCGIGACVHVVVNRCHHVFSVHGELGVGCHLSTSTFSRSTQRAHSGPQRGSRRRVQRTAQNLQIKDGGRSCMDGGMTGTTCLTQAFNGKKVLGLGGGEAAPLE